MCSSDLEPVDVLCEQKDFAGVDADAFEDAVAVEQSVVKDTDDSLFSGDKGTGDVNQSGHKSALVAGVRKRNCGWIMW